MSAVSAGEFGLPATPPYVVVIFRSLRAESDDDADDGYAATAERMAELARDQPGYLAHWSCRDADGRGATLSYWADDASARAWKQVVEHRVAQERGAREWYAAYSVEVATVHRAYGRDVSVD